MTKRDPLKTGLLCALFPFYFIIWHYKANTEIKLHAGTDVNPLVRVLLIIPAGILLIPAVYSFYKLAVDVNNFVEKKQRFNPLLMAVLALIPFACFFYYKDIQKSLNKAGIKSSYLC